MSKLVKVKLTYDGPAKLRCSPEAEELVTEIAAGILGRLGDEYAMEAGVYGGAPEGGNHPRAYAKILPITYEAAKDNAEHNTILKALR